MEGKAWCQTSIDYLSLMGGNSSSWTGPINNHCKINCLDSSPSGYWTGTWGKIGARGGVSLKFGLEEGRHRHTCRDTHTHTHTERHAHTETHTQWHTHTQRHTHTETHMHRHTHRERVWLQKFSRHTHCPKQDTWHVTQCYKLYALTINFLPVLYPLKYIDRHGLEKKKKNNNGYFG